MSVLLSETEIRKAILQAYSVKAGESDQWYPYCYASQSTLEGTVSEALAMGYSRAELEAIPQVSIMALGCGNPVSEVHIRRGDTLLDLGCGGGMDVFLAARLVGPEGKVIGTDITEEMVRKAETAARLTGYHNAEFRLAANESLPIEDESVDIVISNCAIALSTDKLAVLREAQRVMKAGGQLGLCEPAATGPIPESVRASADAWVSGIAGAVPGEQWSALLAEAGFAEIDLRFRDAFAGHIWRGNGNLPVSSVSIRASKPG